MASTPAICFEGEEGKEGMGCSPPPPSRGPTGLPASPSGGGEVGRRGGGGGDGRGRGSPPESPYAGDDAGVLTCPAVYYSSNIFLIHK